MGQELAVPILLGEESEGSGTSVGNVAKSAGGKEELKGDGQREAREPWALATGVLEAGGQPWPLFLCCPSR